MTTLEYRQLGFDIFTFTNPVSRERYKTESLEASGIEFETHECEEIVEGMFRPRFTLYQLAVKRITPTLKQFLRTKAGDPRVVKS